MDNKDKKAEIVIRIVCLILSFGLWLYISNVQNPTREYKLEKVPVELLNADALKEAKLALSPHQDFYVTLNLEGPSSEVYKVTTSQFKVSVDLSSYALKKGENRIRVDIVNYPSNINIKNNSFLLVTIKVDDYVEKSIPIKSDIKVTTKNGTYADTPVIKPTNAVIAGPGEYVNSVKSLVVSSELKNIEQDTTLNLPIKAINDSGKDVDEIKVTPTNAEVSITVKKGKVVPINVITKGNLPAGFVMKDFGSTTEKVELVGDDTVLSGINSIDTEAIDLSSINDSKEVSANLKIPQNVRVADNISKVKVKFDLNKYTTKDIEVPISSKNIPDGLQSTIDPQKITVRISGLEDDVNSFKSDSIKAEVDLSGAKEGDNTIPIVISNSNDKLKLVSQSSDKVKAVLTKKQ
ncbi:CdaR family protein [Clostridium folliculivorans]|uniref:YbbR-like domain-containing protein n=1 Tax=Clostridium folliculivorans TaxID=2886038 RepID=A0A9W6DBR5_9CLOT|nr:CdaR family protein [Clostridium folliculivorans]GKU26192.1 hypothetical protein CFOLD11_30190 [Clostridium folliculivorans]GKU31864.1 hypothetical protein CFB3_39720 [Clostridium folliculivorans]